MGLFKDDIGDEESNNMMCSILPSNVCMDDVSENSEGMVSDNAPKEIKFIPYKIIDNDN